MTKNSGQKRSKFVGSSVMKLLYALILVLFSGCTNEWFCEPIICPPLVRKIDVNQLTRVIVRYSANIQHDFGLRCEDAKVYYSDCTEKIKLVLSSQKIVEIAEARKTITDVVEGLLEALNDDVAVRSDLCNYRFTANDLEIYINFESWYGEFVDPFHVGWLELEGGVISYQMHTVKEYYYDRWNNRIEPYAVALRIARAEEEVEDLYPPDEEHTVSRRDEPTIVEGNISNSKPRSNRTNLKP